MDYGYRVTTGGRELLAALLATGKELEITQVAVGSGRVAEGVNLADMTDLIQYVAEGKIAQRRHIDNVLHLTVQYASNFTPGLGAFYLAEFIVKARHPISGEDVTLLYGTLGDYIQPVSAYSTNLPPDVRDYPIILALSDEINVTVSAPAGLVSYDDLQAAVNVACKELVDSMATGGIKKTITFTIPVDGWLKDADRINGYGFYYDLPDADTTANMIPDVTIAESSLETARQAGICSTAVTYAGYIRLKSVERPAGNIDGSCNLLMRGETGAGGAGSYVLPAATETSLGGVIVEKGSGLTVDKDGRIAIDAATDEDVSGAIDEVFGGETPDEENPDDGSTGDEGTSGGGYEIAGDEEVSDMITDIFG